MIELVFLGIVALATCVTAALTIHVRLTDKPDVQIVRALTVGKARKESEDAWRAQIAVVVANTGSRDALGCVAAFGFPGGSDFPLLRQDWTERQLSPSSRAFDLPSHSQTVLISFIKGEYVLLKGKSGILEVAVQTPAKNIKKFFRFSIDNDSSAESWVTFVPTRRAAALQP
jgi:hypothetical protein